MEIAPLILHKVERRQPPRLTKPAGGETLMQMSINYTVTTAQLGQADDKMEHAPQPLASRTSIQPNSTCCILCSILCRNIP